MKTKIFLMSCICFLPFSSYAGDPGLATKCGHGVRVEIYVAKAAKYKHNGSFEAYKKARLNALEHAAELGYPDYGVDLMIDSSMKSIGDPKSIASELADLTDNGMLLSPLTQDCLENPQNYIRSYK
ncbi:hypothetical protein [Klebsiella pneumoniae]|uniref:hypothetical protein n=1 Tax=Klebsiella pneumoniae TaxID=573 RepID=UPI001E47EF6C|nr:hypothetical protein [Klebsiella pneumoniae]EMB5927801.1 hypothetical protein [Klebsiella pneumoniae]